MPTLNTKPVQECSRFPNGGYYTQQDVSYMAGYGVAIKNSFLNLVPPRGTGWRFKSPPHPIHIRWVPCPVSADN
jgi:hypothetical protein